MHKTATVVVGLVLVALPGCSEVGDTAATPTRTVTATVTVTATPQQQDRSAFPDGYPKVVRVSSLPEALRGDYADSGFKKAVAVAAGVWTPLTPGATVRDALASGVLDGYCASIKAYERKYAGGEQHSGSCW